MVVIRFAVHGWLGSPVKNGVMGRDVALTAKNPLLFVTGRALRPSRAPSPMMRLTLCPVRNNRAVPVRRGPRSTVSRPTSIAPPACPCAGSGRSNLSGISEITDPRDIPVPMISIASYRRPYPCVTTAPYENPTTHHLPGRAARPIILTSCPAPVPGGNGSAYSRARDHLSGDRRARFLNLHTASQSQRFNCFSASASELVGRISHSNPLSSLGAWPIHQLPICTSKPQDKQDILETIDLSQAHGEGFTTSSSRRGDGSASTDQRIVAEDKGRIR